MSETNDLIVELSGVYKTFQQRQRSEKLSEAFRALFRPRWRAA